MILVREVFQIDPERMRAAKAAVREMMTTESELSNAKPRMMTDLIGDYFTLVMEFEAPDLGAFENTLRDVMNNDSWRTAYESFRPTITGGHREVFQIEE